MIEKGYIILIGLLGFVVRLAYIVYAGRKIERPKIIARLVISITMGYIVGGNIDVKLQWHGIMLYGPFIRLSSFFAVDIVEWLVSPKGKDIISKVIKKNIPPLL